MGADFDYMQKAETARLDEAAAISCMEKLLGEFEPCHFLPLLLQAVVGDHNSPDIQVRLMHYKTGCCKGLQAPVHRLTSGCQDVRTALFS